MWALDFVGLGLPKVLFAQTYNMLRQSNPAFEDDLECGYSINDEGSVTTATCGLPGVCTDYDFGTYGFIVKFKGVDNYMTFSLYSLTSGVSSCVINIVELNNDPLTESDQIILGAMVLQDYSAYWEYDMVNTETTLTIQPITTPVSNTTYIGNAVYTDTGDNIFTQYAGQTITLPVTID